MEYTVTDKMGPQIINQIINVPQEFSLLRPSNVISSHLSTSHLTVPTTSYVMHMHHASLLVTSHIVHFLKRIFVYIHRVNYLTVFHVPSVQISERENLSDQHIVAD